MNRHLTSSAALLAVIGVGAIAYPFVSGSHSPAVPFVMMGGFLAICGSVVLAAIARHREFVPYSPPSTRKDASTCDDCACHKDQKKYLDHNPL